jgi:ABC-type multidrug transport system ATPase subunit
MPVLKCHNLTLKMERTVLLSNIDFELQKGDYTVLIGPNGVGKTTFLKTLLGMRSDFEGELDLPSPFLTTLFFSSEPQGFLDLTLLENLEFYENIFKTKVEERLKKEGFKLLSLETHKNKAFKNLSTGQKRLFHILLAYLLKPAFLIMDEPTLGLDKKHRELFLNLFKEKQLGQTCLISTHNEELIALAPLILNLEDFPQEGPLPHDTAINMIHELARDL